MIENHLASIDLNLLVHLQLLLEERSVTRAAARAGLTQSAMSRALGRLRELFDDPLFVRTAGGMEPTVRAERLAEPLRAVLLDLQSGVLASSRFDPATATTEWSIASTDMTDLTLMSAVCRRVAHEAPGLTLHLRGPMTGTESLSGGQCELGVAIAATSDEVTLRARPILTDGFASVLCADHPALSDGRITLVDWLDQGHVLVSPRGRPGGFVDRILGSLGHRRHVAVTTPSFLLAPSLVVGTDHILTMPASMARRLAPPLGLAVIAPPLELPGFTLSLMWHERWQHDPGHRWLRELICQEADSPRDP